MTDGIRNRILRAMDAFYIDDLEEALFQIAPAIDATAKKRYSRKKPGDRVRSFLKDEQDILYGLSTQNRVNVEQSASVIYGEDGEFQSILYKFVRCAQAHDAELDTAKITLGGDFGIGRILIKGASLNPSPGIVLVSRATVLALIFAVLCAAENSQLDLSDITIPFLSEPSLELTPLVGNKAGFIEKYRTIFSQIKL